MMSTITMIRTRLISLRPIFDHVSSSYETNVLCSSLYRNNVPSTRIISFPIFYRNNSNGLRKSTDSFYIQKQCCKNSKLLFNQSAFNSQSFVCLSNTRWFSVDKNSKPKESTQQKNVTESNNSYIDEEIPPEKLGIVAKFKLMYKQYWYILVPVHLITSTGWLIGFYYLSKSGVDIPSLLQTLHVSESIIDKLKNSSMGHLAISYMCYKLMTPVRYMVTVGGTTLSIKYLSQWGYIRPVPSREQFRKMYDDKKAQIKKGYEDLHDKTATAINQAKKNPNK